MAKMLDQRLSIDDQTKFIIAIRGYRSVKTKTGANWTDITAVDPLNKKILLRSIEPKGNVQIDVNEVKCMAELIKRDQYDHAILISRRFSDKAISEMAKENIQRVSDNYMPPFSIERLYTAIVDWVNNQSIVKCGDAPSTNSTCSEKKGIDPYKIKALADNAKYHFEQGWIDLLKNDLKIALALNK